MNERRPGAFFLKEGTVTMDFYGWWIFGVGVFLIVGIIAVEFIFYSTGKAPAIPDGGIPPVVRGRLDGLEYSASAGGDDTCDVSFSFPAGVVFPGKAPTITQGPTLGDQLRHHHKYIVPEQFLFDVLSVAARCIAVGEVSTKSAADDAEAQRFIIEQRAYVSRLLLAVGGQAKALSGYPESAEVQKRYSAHLLSQCIISSCQGPQG